MLGLVIFGGYECMLLLTLKFLAHSYCGLFAPPSEFRLN